MTTITFKQLDVELKETVKFFNTPDGLHTYYLDELKNGTFSVSKDEYPLYRFNKKETAIKFINERM